MTSRVYYLCDRKACDLCGNNCEHTSDIKHAVNFKKNESGDFFEKESVLDYIEKEQDFEAMWERFKYLWRI